MELWRRQRQKLSLLERNDATSETETEDALHILNNENITNYRFFTGAVFYCEGAPDLNITPIEGPVAFLKEYEAVFSNDR